MVDAKRKIILSAGIFALGFSLAACHPVERKGGHIGVFGIHFDEMKVRDKLVCPDQSGDLHRVSAAPDGASCAYRTGNGEDVTLQRLPLAGAAPDMVLAKVEAGLKTEAGPMADTTQPPPKPPAPPSAKADWSSDSDEKADHDKDDDDDDNKAPAQVHDHAKIDLPGFHIDAHGDKADIRIPGVSVNADGDKANVKTGFFGTGVSVNAHDGGAQIRIGKAGEFGTDSMLILASDQPGPTGYQVVGYIAKGPAGGPLVVATFKAKDKGHDDHIRSRGLTRLVNLNVHAGESSDHMAD
jgi:hypothetical protein